MVLFVPMYESVVNGPLYEHRERHRSDGNYSAVRQKAAHPGGEGLLGEVLFRPRHAGTPGFDTAGRQGRRVHCYDRPSPRVAQQRGLTSRRSCSIRRHAPWLASTFLRHRASGGGRANFILRRINRVGIESSATPTSTGRATRRSRGKLAGTPAIRTSPSSSCAPSTWTDRRCPHRWAFYRDRRPTRTTTRCDVTSAAHAEHELLRVLARYPLYSPSSSPPRAAPMDVLVDCEVVAALYAPCQSRRKVSTPISTIDSSGRYVIPGCSTSTLTLSCRSAARPHRITFETGGALAPRRGAAVTTIVRPCRVRAQARW